MNMRPRWWTVPLTLMMLTACVPSVYDEPYPVEEVVLPQDDAAHPAPIEWWYYTGHLTDESGEEYGFELTFFKAYAPPEIELFGFYPVYYLIDRGHVGHFAVTDKTDETFTMGERADFWGYEAGASSDELDVFVGGWSAERAEDGVSHRVRANEGGYEIDLVLTPTKPAALHGDPPGIQSMGPGGTSYYVSYTRMAVSGTLKADCDFSGLACKTLEVSGTAWHDHQWGDFDLSSYAGWDWFSMQFDDNTELMVYLIRMPNGEYTAQAGSFITADGRTLELSEDDLEIIETGKTWTSETTGAVYPIEWRVRVPKHDIDVNVVPVIENQEMDTRASTGIVYWEGAVDLTGSHTGDGFVELTNYDLYPYGLTDENTPLQPLRGPFGGG